MITMEKSLAMRSFVLVTLALFLGFLVTVAASGELPFLPPLDHVQPSTVESPSSEAPGIMSRLIRIYFGDQVVSLAYHCILNFVMTFTFVCDFGDENAAPCESVIDFFTFFFWV